MPELAEVEWYRKEWNVGRGETVRAIDLHDRNRVFRGTNTQELRQRLVGAKFESSVARGKRMLFRFSGKNWLGVHLGMTGKIRSERPDFQPNKHDHLVLYQRHQALAFTDSRQFGRIRFHHGRDEPDWWKTDVPEIASTDFDFSFFNNFLQRHSNAPIKAVLLMQNGFSGIGNWMADEILWRAKVLPSKRSRRLTKREREALFRATKFIVRKSLAIVGKDFSDLPDSWLIHEKWKSNGVCPIHRVRLRHATIGGRTTAWCPKCQKSLTQQRGR